MARAAVRLDASFAALAEPTRRAVIRELMHEPLRAGELAARLGVSAPALSRHLRVLRRAALVQERSHGADARVRVYRLAPRALAPLRHWLDEVEAAWGLQLAAFKAFAEAEADAAPAARRRPAR